METVQERLRVLRKALGLTQDEIADKTGAKRTTVAGYESGVSLPHAEFLTALNKNYGINSNWLLTGEGDMYITEATTGNRQNAKDGQRIPLLKKKITFGQGKQWNNESNIERYVTVFDILPELKNGKVYAFTVSGSSMLGAGIRDGDIVLFDADKSHDTQDGIFVFVLDGDVYCKRLEFDSLSRQIKVYSVRVADLEKAELAMSLKADDPSTPERMTIFGRVYAWVHPEG